MKSIILLQVTSAELVAEIKDSILQELIEILGIADSVSTNKKDELLSKRDVCEHFHIHQSTLHRWVKSGKVACHYLGNKVYFKRSELPIL